VQVTQTSYDPAGPFIETAAAVDLWDEVQRELVTNGDPAIEYLIALLDLERSDGSKWGADEIILGGNLDLRDSVLAISGATPRVVRYAPNEYDPEQSVVGLSTTQQPLTRLLSG
jgi:hypothetical protein